MTLRPAQRVRGLFEATAEKYREEGYLGCLLGGPGQELSGISEAFRRKVERDHEIDAQTQNDVLAIAYSLKGDILHV